MQKHRPDRILDKVLSRVLIKDMGYENGPCWLWQGPTSGTGRGGGYPRMSLDGGTVAVHIVMYILQEGPIPPRKQIDHKCRNRLCVNPSHLEMVTHLVNQRRRDAEIRMTLSGDEITCEEIINQQMRA